MHPYEKLSTLWIFVMINIIIADIVGFVNPGALEAIINGSTGFEITQELVLVFAVLLQIPTAMILLARMLPYQANRWANIGAAVITILFVIGGGSATLSYYFFATIEVITMLYIIWFAWRLPQPRHG
jgi:Sec-independent protein secretion pathway component TatC